MWLMMFCFRSILQIWIIMIGFRDTNDFLNLVICKHEFKFTCRSYCRFTLSLELLHLYTTHSRGEMEVTDIPTSNLRVERGIS